MPKLRTGRIVMTRGVLEEVADNEDFSAFVFKSLKRHINCDWGDVDDEDKEINDSALKHKLRILSAYNDERFPKQGISNLWIITEADRSSTTILFPDEY